MSQKPRVVAVSVAVATLLPVAWLFWGMSSSQEGRHLGGSAGAQIPDSSPAAQSTDGVSVSKRGVPRVLVRAIDGFGNLITEGVSFQDGSHRDCAFAWRVDEKLYAVNISPGELLTVKHSDFGTRTFRVHADTINVVQFSKEFSVVVNVLEALHDRVWRLTLRERKERQTVELQIPVASSRDVAWSSTEYVRRAGVYSVMAQSARGWLEQLVEIGSQDETVVYIDMNDANRVAKGNVVLQLRVLTAPQSPLAQEDVPYVVKFSTGSWHTGTGRTSGIGELRIDTLHTPAGSQVMLMHPEYEDRSIEVSVPDFGVVNIGEVVLQPYASIRQFRVVDEHDTPIAGAKSVGKGSSP